MNEALTKQLLEWLAESPRGYQETMEAWRTSCPRLAIWEDSELLGLVRTESGEVRITEKGLQWLRSAGQASQQL